MQGKRADVYMGKTAERLVYSSTPKNNEVKPFNSFFGELRRKKQQKPSLKWTSTSALTISLAGKKKKALNVVNIDR